MKTLNPKQKRQLKLKAIRINPVVLIGAKGLTEAVQKEIQQALLHHELIKIRFHQHDREALIAAADTICAFQEATLIDRMGHVIVIYKPLPSSSD